MTTEALLTGFLFRSRGRQIPRAMCQKMAKAESLRIRFLLPIPSQLPLSPCTQTALRTAMKYSLRRPASHRNHHGRGNGGISPKIDGYKVDAHTAVETSYVVTQAALGKAALSWPDLLIKGFLGGIFISIGSLFDLIVAGGATSLRANNPSIATMLSAFVFPVGFVLVILTNTELVTSNMYTMAYGAYQRKISVWSLIRNWVFVYISNLAGCLFFAGILTWWSDSMDDAQSSYAVTDAEGRVNVDWQVNFLRGIGCNFLVALAMFLASSAKDLISKIFAIWIPIVRSAL